MLKNIYFESTMFEKLLVAKLLKSLFRFYSLSMSEN